jgi:hypothetical protein
MSPALTILLALLSRIRPEDVAALVKEIVAFVDPLIASKGFLVRSAWSIIRSLVLSPSVGRDLVKLLSDVKSNPQVAAASSELLI